MNNKAKKEYPSKLAAKKAMIQKAHYIHDGSRYGHIPFGRIWCEGNFVYADSDCWTESTLNDFLNNKRKL